MMGNLVEVKAEEIQIGDKILGYWEVIAIQRADNFGNPALQFTFPNKEGRLIVNVDANVPVAE